MTIEECIAILSYPTYYFPSVREEALDMTIDTMRKYQQIEKIYKNWSYGADSCDCMKDIERVLEDGNDRA